jgi:hypothetical protein
MGNYSSQYRRGLEQFFRIAIRRILSKNSKGKRAKIIGILVLQSPVATVLKVKETWFPMQTSQPGTTLSFHLPNKLG